MIINDLWTLTVNKKKKNDKRKTVSQFLASSKTQLPIYCTKMRNTLFADSLMLETANQHDMLISMSTLLYHCISSVSHVEHSFQILPKYTKLKTIHRDRDRKNLSNVWVLSTLIAIIKELFALCTLPFLLFFPAYHVGFISYRVYIWQLVLSCGNF